VPPLRHNVDVSSEPEDTDNQAEVLIDRPLPAYLRAVKGGGAVTVLSAAMIAVGEILEPEKARVELVQPSDTSGDTGFDLDFGELPPLD